MICTAYILENTKNRGVVMNCNFKQNGSFRFDGLLFTAFVTPCKACKNNRVCGFEHLDSDCKKFIPKGCK